MIETTVKTYLDTALEGIPVYLETPKNTSGTFIVFQLIERGKENLINEATLEFRSYADSKYDAAALDEALREAMDTLNESDITAKLGGGNDDTDTTLKKYRYRCYYNLYY